ncbi:MAG: DNA-binding response regulator [Bacteroidetes bacterium]|nr:MAG: DNA-binding response regulator [Bacteroidota bacterium]
MSKIKVLILEDLPFQRMELAAMLEDNGYEVAAAVGSVEEALNALETHRPDLALLDIKIEGEDEEGGIKVGEAINARKRIPIIYLTALEEAFEKAKTTRPAGYLTKPYHPADVFRNIDLAFYNFYGQRESLGRVHITPTALLIKESDVMEKVAFSHILYAKARNNDILLYVDYEREHYLIEPNCFFITSIQLGKFAEALPPSQFMRVHRSYLVNLAAVRSGSARQLILGTHEVPVSEKYREEVMRRLQTDLPQINAEV